MPRDSFVVKSRRERGPPIAGLGGRAELAPARPPNAGYFFLTGFSTEIATASV
jgi:hypothetical protein